MGNHVHVDISVHVDIKLYCTGLNNLELFPQSVANTKQGWIKCI